jgi:hypothetical protein
MMLPTAKVPPELRARAETLSAVVPAVLAAAGRLPQPDPDSMPELYALALHGTIIHLFSGCVLLAQWGEPTGIPVLLRSEYEALVDLDNVLVDPSYACRIEHANIKQTLNIMRSKPLRDAFQKGRKDIYDEQTARLAELEYEGKASLKIWQRCKTVGRSDEYDSVYALFCLEAHNNASALAERHLSEKDGRPEISYFGDFDTQVVIRRLDMGLKWLFESVWATHGKFRVRAPEVETMAARFQQAHEQARAAAAPDAP